MFVPELLLAQRNNPPDEGRGKTSILSWLVVVVVALGGICTPAFAYPPKPSSFYGTVEEAGNAVSVGTKVEAVIAGEVVASTETFSYNGETWYFFDVLGDDAGTVEKEGGIDDEWLSFRVAGVRVDAEEVWIGGTLRRLDLVIAEAATATPDPLHSPPVITAANTGQIDCDVMSAVLTIRGENFISPVEIVLQNDTGGQVQDFLLTTTTTTRIVVLLQSLDTLVAGRYHLTVRNSSDRQAIRNNVFILPDLLASCPGVTLPTATPIATATPIYVISQTPIYATATPGYTVNPTRTPPVNDDDGDGMDDDWEKEQGLDPTDPDDGKRDDDGDGMDNETEYRNNTNPKSQDTDGDGLTDNDEIYRYHTNPTLRDTDGEGLDDGQEIFDFGTNPLNRDTDGGGVDDFTEIMERHTDPLDGNTASVSGVVYSDSNRNGQRDADEIGVVGVTLELHSTVRTTVSGANGIFSFERVTPGFHRLTLAQSLLDRLQTSFTPLTLEQVVEDQVLEVAIPITTAPIIDLLPKTGNSLDTLFAYLVGLFFLMLLVMFLRRRKKQQLSLAGQRSQEEHDSVNEVKKEDEEDDEDNNEKSALAAEEEHEVRHVPIHRE